MQFAKNIPLGKQTDFYGGHHLILNERGLIMTLDLRVKGGYVGFIGSKFVGFIAPNPAKRFNLSNKGEFPISKGADILLFDRDTR
ncbi:hypothetical protein [Bacillus sp. FJAT-27245]|uniref:hypothetical protein n=1 Tax=Bacillus sp. FJAT-27245 TaxID=1684144 RepID=UPI0006A7CBE2|nr:hypothetical protein [Bacillus sp. FJAT-27245]